MEQAARLARFGDRIVSAIAAALILLMLLYGGYSLWDTAMVFNGAFVSNDLLQFKPVSTDPDSNPTLAELQQINPDCIAWLTVDDTHIDYPVVQGEDNMEYINTDVYGKFALSGAIFLDNTNAPDFSDPYSLVYGHHMDNGAMFGDVVEFVKQDYFDAHSTGTLYLPDATYSISIFACVQTDAFDSLIFNPTYQTDGDVSSLLDYIQANALHTRDIGVTSSDHIIGLSTCSEAETNGRVIIFGRLDRVSSAPKEAVETT
ncbi:class B sortase [uncultured Subdoligranulum sp.]|uniref:class B sortase n=1 Tax=uncultured Subdoligranulum sp. TaxID=512298 RepID=UPI0025EE28FC|nr:class B sortase [uncultured Subdoligranulum sp.]